MRRGPQEQSANSNCDKDTRGGVGPRDDPLSFGRVLSIKVKPNSAYGQPSGSNVIFREQYSHYDWSLTEHITYVHKRSASCSFCASLYLYALLFLQKDPKKRLCLEVDPSLRAHVPSTVPCSMISLMVFTAPAKSGENWNFSGQKTFQPFHANLQDEGVALFFAINWKLLRKFEWLFYCPDQNLFVTCTCTRTIMCSA